MEATLIDYATFEALGTTASVTTSGDLGIALAAVREVVAGIDAACSRFRPDSDLSTVNEHAGSYVPVGRTFMEALTVALDAARRTRGAVDPTIGSALLVLGYDRSFADVPASGPAVIRTAHVPGWRVIDINVSKSQVKVPHGVRLDFGATAKGFAADRAAAVASARCGSGVLVSLGGDIALAGEAPAGGWLVGIADNHRSSFADAEEAVLLSSGGLATSSTTVRRWSRGEQQLHHVVDPATGTSADVVWRTVSVAADSCVEANICTTAAIVLGDGAVDWLIAQGHPARLVSADGDVVRLNGWPLPEADEQAVSPDGPAVSPDESVPS
jgi:FAD:protein FMN transferase